MQREGRLEREGDTEREDERGVVDGEDGEKGENWSPFPRRGRSVGTLRGERESEQVKETHNSLYNLYN